jgi:prepilin-type N-terminal cleavage/methylation domain-containing protein
MNGRVMSASAEGFSLLEVLVALVIIGTAGLSSLALALQLARGSAAATEATTAEVLAFWTMGRATLDPPGSTKAAAYAPPFDQYIFRTSVTPLIGTGTSSITVEVDWPGGTTTTTRLVFDSVRAPR